MTLTATGSLQTKYLVDGVMAAYRGTFVAAGQQVTDAPAGYRNSLKFTVSTAQSSLGSNDELSVLIPVEGVRAARLALGTASAAAISFGFWVKAHRTGTYSGSLRNSARNRSYPFSFAVNAADTWEFKTVTFGGDTAGTWLADTGVGFYLNLCIAGGSSRVGTAGAWAGSDCERRDGHDQCGGGDQRHVPGHRADRAARHRAAGRGPRAFRHAAVRSGMPVVQRYLEATYGIGVLPGANTAAGCQGGLAATTGAILACFPFKVQKRVAPSMTLYGESGTSGVFSAVGGGNTAAASASGSVRPGSFRSPPAA